MGRVRKELGMGCCARIRKSGEHNQQVADARYSGFQARVTLSRFCYFLLCSFLGFLRPNKVIPALTVAA